MAFDALARLRRHGRRVGEVMAVLARYGLADGLRWLKVDWVQDRLRGADGSRLRDQPLEARIRLALTELGTTFIKLGQTLGTRPDLVGGALAAELSRLHARTTADAPEVVRATLTAELGCPPEQAFAEFCGDAFASASIAQVHDATLHTGERVVIKVMRAGVQQQAVTDLEILQALARLAQRHAPLLRPYQPELLARQFQRTMLRELDFSYEREHLERFARNFAGDATVHFPRVNRQLCSKRVLTMERLDGLAATELTAGRGGPELTPFARHGGRIWLEMIFRDGFYHADPHPGNLVLMPGEVVGVLDCGMVGRIDDSLRQQVEAMLLAAVEHDAAELGDLLLRLGHAPPDIDREALGLELAELLDDFVGHELRYLELGAVLGSLLGIVHRYHVVLPAPLALLLRTVIVLEGTSRTFDRDFSLAELVEPIYRRVRRNLLSPRRVLRRLRHDLRDWDRLLSVLPGDLRVVLDRLREGSFRLRLDHRHLDGSVNRLTLGILIAALVLGASALWTSDAPPRLGNVSLLGLLGFLLAGFLGLRLRSAARRARRGRDGQD